MVVSRGIHNFSDTGNLNPECGWGDYLTKPTFFDRFAPIPVQNLDLYSSATLRHLDHLPLPTTSYLVLSFSVMPDVDGDEYEDFILGGYDTPGVLGAVGRITMKPVLSVLASGNHPTGAQPLRVNGDPGLPARRIDLTVNQPFSISFDVDPVATGITDFLIFGMIGVPNAASVYNSFLGSFVLIPRPASPNLPWLFTLADSLAFDPAALFNPTPAPFSLPVPQGLFLPIHLALQGVSVINAGSTLSISNAILLNVR